MLSDYSTDLKQGGFHPNWIKNCLDSAIVGYSKMIKSEKDGKTPITHLEHACRNNRKIKKLTGKSNWFQNK